MKSFFSNEKPFSDTSQHFYISNDNTFKMVNSAIKLTATRKACGIKYYNSSEMYDCLQ